MSGPNGKHLIGTVLLRSLLPKLAYHVLSRAGPTDLIDTFWFSLNNAVHSSGHIKYAELSLYYTVLRAIFPKLILRDVYIDTPTLAVWHIPSYTGRAGPGGLDDRNWVYVHADELLECLIIRFLKALGIWDPEVIGDTVPGSYSYSRTRFFGRPLGGASRAHGKFASGSRGADDSGAEPSAVETPLTCPYRFSAQHRSVQALLALMEKIEFLDATHRLLHQLKSVFTNPPVDMRDLAGRQELLDSEALGLASAMYHANRVFPCLIEGLA